MMKKLISVACVVSLMAPASTLIAQETDSPEKAPTESKLVNKEPSMTTMPENSQVDSVPNAEVLAESLVVAPLTSPPVTVPLESEEEIPQYGFKGTGRDIVIGAAVLTGWFVVAFLAANQKSE